MTHNAAMPQDSIIKQNWYINSLGRRVPLQQRDGNQHKYPEKYFMSYLYGRGIENHVQKDKDNTWRQQPLQGGK